MAEGEIIQILKMKKKSLQKNECNYVVKKIRIKFRRHFTHFFFITIETTTVDPDLPIIDDESRENNATMALAYGPISSTCSKRGDLSFYVYYTLWRNDRMPMYVVSCTSPRADGVDYGMILKS